MHLIEIFDPTTASLGPSNVSLKSTINDTQSVINMLPHVYLHTCMLATYIAMYVAMQISNNL